jgi:hypothetical protein
MIALQKSVIISYNLLAENILNFNESFPRHGHKFEDNIKIRLIKIMLELVNWTTRLKTKSYETVSMSTAKGHGCSLKAANEFTSS